MDEDLKLNDIDVNLLSNEELLDIYNDLEAFLKLVNEEIKKTDTGDQDEWETK